MKHIFHIQSNINLVSALGIIEFKALNKDDVILSVCRNINVSYLPYEICTIPDTIYYHSYNKLSTLRKFDWLCNKTIISLIDDFIKNVSDSNNFIYYCPNSRNFHHRVFITNKYCKGVEYIEDGMDAYLEENLYYKKYPYELRKRHYLAQELLFKWFNAFCYNRLYQEDDPFKSYYGHKAKIYCISEKAYSFRNEVSVLPLEKIAKNIKLEVDIINDNDHIFILDAVVEQQVVPIEIYRRFIKYFITIFDNKSLKIKFHPYQEESLKEWTLNEFKENSIHVTEVEEEMPFELILLCKNNLTIYGIGSSLLLYSSYIGNHKTNIHYPVFEDKLGYQSSRLPYWKSAFKEL
jgi:hypothetical protein